MKKERINTAVFFTLLYWLLTYIFIIRKGFIFGELNLTEVFILAGINLLMILVTPLLVPVFRIIMALTSKLGSLIFGLITSVVFYLILTPISLIRKIGGKKLIQLGFNEDADTYFEPWESSSDFSKQY